jgi:N-acetylmuramoyl-L-alanine amidase
LLFALNLFQRPAHAFSSSLSKPVLHLHTIVKRLVYLGCIHLLTLLLCVGAQAAFAQEKLNYLAVNGTLDDNLGPFYFRAQGNAKDAYVQLNLLAEKLGYSYSYDGLKVTLKNNYRTIELKTTNNIVVGLEKRPDVLSVNGGFLESPMGIIVGDVAYGAVTPVLGAMGGAVKWHNPNGERLVYIDYDPSVDVPKPEAAAPAAQPATPAAEVQTTSGTVGSPRIGPQEDGRTRVVIDLPPNAFYEVFAHDKTLIVTLPQLGATPFTQNFPNDPNIDNVRYALVDNKVALVVTTRYPLQQAGAGFSFALLPAAETAFERFYVDFSPSMAGTAVKSAQSMQVQDMSSAKMPAAQQKVVVIDVGHGAHDPGAVSAYVQEKDVVLAVAQKLQAYLQAQGIQVIMTRSDDTFLELSERAAFATPDINMFVSIHANAATASASGIETWVFGQSLEPGNLARAIEENGGGAEGEALTQEAQYVAQGITGDIYRESQLQYSLDLATVVQSKMIAATGAKDRGVKQAEYYVIRNARSPAILVEAGFVSNAEEGSKLATNAYQDTLARAIADGIVQFFGAGTTIASSRQQP